MVIERYSDKYNEDVKYLVQSFYDESVKEYGIVLDLNALENSINELKDNMYLLVIDGKCEGILSGRIAKTAISDIRIWQEIMWYVSKKYRKYGVYLLKHVKDILRTEGFGAMVMICMENSKKEKLFKLYRRLGFKPMEHHFIGGL